jgi:hypothetical protein
MVRARVLWVAHPTRGKKQRVRRLPAPGPDSAHWVVRPWVRQQGLLWAAQQEQRLARPWARVREQARAA